MPRRDAGCKVGPAPLSDLAGPDPPEEPGQHHRAGDLVDPVWGLLDLSPEGPGDFFPQLSYD